MAKKHLMIFNNGGVVSATTPKDWARGHQNAFPNHTFDDPNSTPTTDAIEAYLINSLGFSKVENQEVVILYPIKEI